MRWTMAKTLAAAAAALMAGAAFCQEGAAQAVLAVCPAGHVFETVHRLKLNLGDKPPRVLVIAVAGQALPPDCAQSPLAFSAAAVRWLGVLPGDSVKADRLAITTREDGGDVLGVEEDKPQPLRPSRHLPSRRPRDGAMLPKPLSAWAWDPQAWRDNPLALIGAARRIGIGALYVSIPIAAGEVEHAEALAAFIVAAAAAGIEVCAVEGDPEMITAEGLAAAVLRARGLAKYSAEHPHAALAGVQYDIEPYLLPSFGAAPAAAWTRWSIALRTLSEALGQPLDAVIPYWINTSPGGEDALAAARPALRGMTIMAYRTDLKQIQEAAAPALLFVERAGLPATVALEAGPIAQERRTIFRSASAGELHLARLGDVTVALLMNEPQPGGRSHAFRHSHSVLADPARITFAGDTARLLAVAGALSRELTAYPAAQRIALHGLPELDTAKTHNSAPQKESSNDRRRENPAH
jgi:hypothetical protein